MDIIVGKAIYIQIQFIYAIAAVCGPNVLISHARYGTGGKSLVNFLYLSIISMFMHQYIFFSFLNDHIMKSFFAVLVLITKGFLGGGIMKKGVCYKTFFISKIFLLKGVWS